MTVIGLDLSTLTFWEIKGFLTKPQTSYSLFAGGQQQPSERVTLAAPNPFREAAVASLGAAFVLALLSRKAEIWGTDCPFLGRAIGLEQIQGQTSSSCQIGLVLGAMASFGHLAGKR